MIKPTALTLHIRLLYARMREYVTRRLANVSASKILAEIHAKEVII